MRVSRRCGIVGSPSGVGQPGSDSGLKSANGGHWVLLHRREASVLCATHIRGRMVVKHSRRRFLHLAAVTVALPAWTRSARAQPYPSRPVRLVVNLAPGGGLDFMSRVVGEYLSRALGQQ